MYVLKSELAKKLSKIKNAVPSKTQVPVLRNVLVRNGYLTASDMEVTLQVPLEDAAGEEMLLPPGAVELISSLPEGEMEIATEGNRLLQIRQATASADFPTMDPVTFPESAWKGKDEQFMEISAFTLLECMKNVRFAMAKTSANKMMESLYMSCHNGMLNFVALDGHQIAWDQTEYEGDFDMLIPGKAVGEMIKMDLKGDVRITYTSLSAVFSTEECTIQTRLVESKNYFPYQKVFREYAPIQTSVNKLVFADALARANLCSESGEAIRLTFEGDHLLIKTIGMTPYTERVSLRQDIVGAVSLGIDGKLLKTAVGNFEGNIIQLNIAGSKDPIIMTQEGSNLKELVLPVNIGI